MASPFHVFRKHQKILIATLGLLAMIAFVFLPMFLESSHQKEAKKNPVVVTTDKYGDLREIEIANMQYKRRLVRNFLNAVVNQAANGEQAFVYYQTVGYIAPLMFGDLSEKETVTHWLMVKRAKELGMTVSDDAVNRFLIELSANRLDGQAFNALFKQFNIHEDFLFDALQDEIMASNLMRMFLTGLDRGTTPDQRWNYFQRLKRRVDLEVVPIDVAAFVDDKSDPGDKELKKFFDKYKDNFYREELPNPGFRVTPTVAIEYVKAEYDKYADPASVTDEEIEAFYNENRENYLNMQLPALDLDEPEPSATPSEAIEKAQEDNTTDDTTAEGQKDTASAEAETQPATEKPATDEPAAKQPEKEPAEKPSEKSGDKTSNKAAHSPFRFVSMSDEVAEETKDKGEESETAEPTDEKATAPAEVAKEAPKSSPKEAVKETPKAAIALPSLPVDKSAEAKKTSKDEESEKTTPAAEPAKPLPKYQPLEEVKEDIRLLLARKKVRERILKGFKPIRLNMSKYHKALITHEASKDDDGNASVPAPTIDLKALINPAAGSYWVIKKGKLINAEEAKKYKSNEIMPADQFGSLIKTKLITVEELGEKDIAHSMTEGGQVFQRAVFSSVPVYMPGISWDSTGNGYLFWKTDEKEERVPEFKEVRDKVLKAWQFNEARKAATERAEQLAKQAREAGISFKDSIGKEPGIDVYETGEFTWITTDNTLTTRPRLSVSDVKHVKLAGDEFMQKAYDLELGQVGVAMNQPQTTVYVMRLVKTGPLESVLMSSFEIEDYSKYDVIGNHDRNKLIANWLGTLEKDAGIEWVRPAKPAPRKTR